MKATRWPRAPLVETPTCGSRPGVTQTTPTAEDSLGEDWADYTVSEINSLIWKQHSCFQIKELILLIVLSLIVSSSKQIASFNLCDKI